MKIVPAHLNYWRAKKAPVPSWYQQRAPKHKVSSAAVASDYEQIDHLINCQSPCYVVETDIRNTLVLLRMMNKRGVSQLDAVQQLASQSVTPSAKRQQFCERLLRRHARAAAGRKQWRRSIEQQRRLHREGSLTPNLQAS